MQDKQVEKKNLKELFKHNISIPLYHREYKWGESEVGEILESVIEGFEKGKSLYMGTLIFYKCEDRCEVIDGQQRLSSLFLTLETLRVESGFEKIKIEKNTQEKLKKLIDERLQGKKGIEEYVKENIEFSCVFCHSLDECFALFDDINTKGKQYEIYELIKIFHLGKMRERGEEELIEFYATKFDEISQRAKGARIRKLFYELLSLARIWIRDRSSECIREKSGVKKEEFEKRVYEEFCPKIDKSFEVFTSSSFQEMGILRDFGEGKGFFEYLFYFDSLLDRIEGMPLWSMIRGKGGKNNNFQEIQPYLRFIYEMINLIYLDKFRDANFEIAHLWIFRAVFSLLLQNQKITRESARDWGKKLLAILYHSGGEREFIFRLSQVIKPHKETLKNPKLYKIMKVERERYLIPNFGGEE